MKNNEKGEILAALYRAAHAMSDAKESMQEFEAPAPWQEAAAGLAVSIRKLIRDVRQAEPLDIN